MAEAVCKYFISVGVFVGVALHLGVRIGGPRVALKGHQC